MLAPNDATSIAVIATNGWGTDCVVLADGTSWVAWRAMGGAGISCSGFCTVHDECLATSGDTYTVTNCYMRVLARCG